MKANSDTDRPRIRTLWLVPVLLFISLVAWSFASPVGSSPDDDFHLVSSWCGLGDREGLCESTGDPTTRMIAYEIATSAGCYVYAPETSAGCVIQYPNGSELVEAVRGNFQGLYPPVFYAVTGLFASPNIAVGAITIRIVNSALFVGAVTALFLLLPPRRQPTLIWGLLITVIPLGLFIIASNNPSAWAVISAGILWLSIVGYFESSGRRRIGLAAVAIAAVVMAAGARADAAAYSALAAIIAVILTFERSRRYLRAAWLPAVVVVIAIVFYRLAGQGSSAAGGLSSPTEQGTDPFVLLAYNLLNLPTLWAGVFDRLGWLDTEMPGIVTIGALLCFLVLVFAGLGYLSRRKGISLAIVLAALIAVPSYVLVQSNAFVGAEVQPRYILPLIILLAGLALFRVGEGAFSMNTVQRSLVAALLTIAQSISLHFTMRRFITGIDVGSVNLDEDIEWWWAGFFSPMTVWVVGSIAFGVAVVLIVRRFDPMAARPRGSELVAVGKGIESTD